MELNIELKHLKQVASLSALTNPKDASKALTMIVMDIDANGITAMATDRYVAGILTIETNTGATEPHKTYLPQETAKWILSLKIPRSTYTQPTATLSFHDSHTTITYGLFSHTYRDTDGSYPDIGKIFQNIEPTDIPTPIRYNPNRIAQLGKLLDSDGKKLESWIFTQSKPSEGKKYSPTLAVADSYKVLIQPMVLP